MDNSYTNKLQERYVKQRERLLDASLETAGRYDRTLMTVSSGALALSVAFIDKIASNPVQWTISIVVVAWIFLLASVVSQLLALNKSSDATKHQVKLLDAEYEFYFSSDDPAEKVREGYTQNDNPFSAQTIKYSTIARWSLIFGVLLVFVFSATNLWLKERENMCDERQSQISNTERTQDGEKKGSYTPERSERPVPPPPKKDNESNQ